MKFFWEKVKDYNQLLANNALPAQLYHRKILLLQSFYFLEL